MKTSKQRKRAIPKKAFFLENTNYISTKDVSLREGISVGRVHKLIKNNRLFAIKKGGFYAIERDYKIEKSITTKEAFFLENTNYISTKDVSLREGISVERVNKLIKNNRLFAIKKHGFYIIEKDYEIRTLQQIYKESVKVIDENSSYLSLNEVSEKENMSTKSIKKLVENNQLEARKNGDTYSIKSNYKIKET